MTLINMYLALMLLRAARRLRQLATWLQSRASRHIDLALSQKGR